MHEVGNDLGQQIAGFVIRPSHHPASCETYPAPRHAASSRPAWTAPIKSGVTSSVDTRYHLPKRKPHHQAHRITRKPALILARRPQSNLPKRASYPIPGYAWFQMGWNHLALPRYSRHIRLGAYLDAGVRSASWGHIIGTIVFVILGGCFVLGNGV